MFTEGVARRADVEVEIDGDVRRKWQAIGKGSKYTSIEHKAGRMRIKNEIPPLLPLRMIIISVALSQSAICQQRDELKHKLNPEYMCVNRTTDVTFMKNAKNVSHRWKKKKRHCHSSTPKNINF